MIAKPPQKEAKLLWECFGELKERAKTECMTPKEKAQELVKKFTEHTRIFDSQFGWHDNIESAKQCAIIAVDEILKLVSHDLDLYYKDCIYWEQVKTEIQAL